MILLPQLPSAKPASVCHNWLIKTFWYKYNMYVDHSHSFLLFLSIACPITPIHAPTLMSYKKHDVKYISVYNLKSIWDQISCCRGLDTSRSEKPESRYRVGKLLDRCTDAQIHTGTFCEDQSLIIWFLFLSSPCSSSVLFSGPVIFTVVPLLCFSWC